MTAFPPDLAGFAAAAQAELDPAVWSYLAHGDEAGDNQAAWRRIRLRPRILRGVREVQTRVKAFGRALATPILAAPAGRATRWHGDGEAAVLEGVRRAGSAALLASSVSPSLERLATRVPTANAWSQLYLTADAAHTAAHIARAEAAGCTALVLTVDLLPGRTPDLPPPPVPEWETKADAAPAPLFAAASLDDLARLCAQTRLPVAVKGVLRADDAAACLDAGAKGLIVSNHGGAQLASARATAEALPEIVDVAAGRAEIYVDGGIRTGEDVLKALALGARGVLIGRSTAHGLAVGGADGVAAVIQTLTGELKRAMALCGASSVEALGPDLLA